MRSVFRHLSPFIRSRRRLSFLFTLVILLSLSFTLFIIDYHQQSTVLIEKTTATPEEQSKPISGNTIKRLIRKSPLAQKKGAWPVDEKGRSLKTHFLALDWTGFFGSGAGEGERVQCPSSGTTFHWTRQQNQLHEVDFVISHGGQSDIPFDRLQINDHRQQYSMAFIMESEVHSSTGDGWARFNFKMTYNLNDSYPEPATYFDMNSYLVDLLKPPMVPFEDKEKHADVVWIISNCNAHNGREGFVQQLMQEMKIDSYGSCLNNRHGYSGRMTSNVEAYKKYKFVIAIENSNCADYVTEKLVKAVESGSIPIVAGRDGRPDYRRYMPKHSYINIFDYPSIKALAEDLKRIGNNQTLYESYLWYKKHDKDLSKLRESSLEDKLKHVADVIGANTTIMSDGIAGKEKSENKVCKLIRFVRETPWQEIVAHQKTARAGPNIACLSGKYIVTHFASAQKNPNQSVGG